jgi:hypothetical protein
MFVLMNRPSLFYIVLFLLQLGHATEHGPLMAPLVSRQESASLFSFNDTWHVLGPFQIGTRGTSLIVFTRRR